MSSRVRLPTCTNCKTVVYEVNKRLLCNACRRHIRENGRQLEVHRAKLKRKWKFDVSRELHSFVLSNDDDDDDDIPASQDTSDYDYYQ